MLPYRPRHHSSFELLREFRILALDSETPGMEHPGVVTCEVSIDRIETTTGLHNPLRKEAVSVFSGTLWPHIRLHQGQSRPRDWPEGYFPRHVISVNVAGHYSMDIWWAGKRHTASVFPGSVTVFPADMPWSSRTPRASSTILIDFAPEFVASVIGRDVDTRDLEIYPALAMQDDRLASFASMLATEARAGGPNGNLYAEGLATALVAYLLRRHGPAPSQTRSPARGLSAGDLQWVTRYIDDHLDTRLSLQMLADPLGMSVYRLVRAFGRSTGVPPYRYVLQRRIERSKSLLAHSTVPLTEVALASGFASQSHFTAAFRRFTRMAPGQYRRSIEQPRRSDTGELLGP